MPTVQIRRMISIGLTATALMGAAVSISGCSHQSDTSSPTPTSAVSNTPAATQARAQAIQNNPGIPDAEKAAILKQSAPRPAPGAPSAPASH